jgi:hypothetical protein
MKFLNFFLLLWVIFALLDPNPDPDFNTDPDLLTLIRSKIFFRGRYKEFLWTGPGLSIPVCGPSHLKGAALQALRGQVWYSSRIVSEGNQPGWAPVSIECFIESQAFWRESPRPPLPPRLPSATCLSFSVFLCVAVRAFWRERGEGMGEEPNQLTAIKPGPQ